MKQRNNKLSQIQVLSYIKKISNTINNNNNNDNNTMKFSGSSLAPARTAMILLMTAASIVFAAKKSSSPFAPVVVEIPPYQLSVAAAVKACVVRSCAQRVARRKCKSRQTDRNKKE